MSTNNNKQENVKTYELTTNITKKDVATAFVIVFMLLAAALGISSCINKGKEHKIEKLKQAMRELEWEKEDKICDSLYLATDIPWNCCKTPTNTDKHIQKRIDAANREIRYLREEAIEPISKKYPLTKFLTSAELAQINKDIAARATNCLYPDSTYCKHYGNDIGAAINDLICELNGLHMIDNPLAKTESVYDFEIYMQTLYALERKSGKSHFYIQVPNENPMASIQDGELSFVNPAAQKLYEQYKKDVEIDADFDQKHIFTNPKLASRYCEYSKALNQAYEDREKLRQIGDFFTKKYQPQVDSLNYQLNQLKDKNH